MSTPTERKLLDIRPTLDPPSDLLLGYSIDSLLNYVDPWLIGMWKFRQPAQLDQCCTIAYKGLYYDTNPQRDRRSALIAAWGLIRLLETTSGPCPVARGIDLFDAQLMDADTAANRVDADHADLLKLNDIP